MYICLSGFLAEDQFDHSGGSSSFFSWMGYIFHRPLVICYINPPPMLENALSPRKIMTWPIHNCELIFLNAGYNVAVHSEHVLRRLA